MVFRWVFVGAAALIIGLGFGVLSGNVVLAAVSAVLVLGVAACLSWEGRPLRRPTRAASARSGRLTGAEKGYPAIWGGTADPGSSSTGDCGPGGDGGGSFGGDGGGAGGC